MPVLMQSARLLYVTAALSCLLAAPAHGAPPAIDPPRLPAAGRRTATITVTEPGRYAITAASGAGTALQLVDRLAGPGEVAGVPGERDGRLDLLLDSGTYRLVTLGAERAAGEVRLEARPFREPDAPRPGLLVENKLVAASLGDFEQRSWWLQIDTARRVVLEAAGRNLADLRLFRDGGWLLADAPVRDTVEPTPGRPLRVRRIVARLEPGLYLLTAFGGPDEPWPAGGEEHPLHLRFGIPSLGDAGRARYRVSPFGTDHFVVPGSVTFVQLELPEAAAALLAEAPFPGEGDPFGEARAAAAITKEHREPAAALEPDAQAEPRLITVRAAAGQPYVLGHFEARDSYAFQRSGRYWLGSIHSGHPQDSADATAIVTSSAAAPNRGSPASRGLDPAHTQAIEIDAAHGWARRCNLLDTLTIFFRVRSGGNYEVLLRGGAARARFEPFLVSRPQDYREPALKPGGATWKLEAGWHVLTVVPDEPGIVEAAVRPAGKLDAIWDLLDPNRPLRGEPVRPAVTFPAIELDWKSTYTVHLNARPGVRSGLVLRELPVDLAQPLPLALRPGEQIAVSARVAEDGTVSAESEAGASLEVRAGSGPWLKALETRGGTLELVVRNPGKASVLASLRFEATRLRESAPLPVPPAAAQRELPDFPSITEGSPVFLDLARRGTATFTVRAADQAFYTLESTGLLWTEGTLRSRFTPALAGAAGGGAGRNFLVGAYLREGEYQVTVTARESTHGHLGVRLRRAALGDGGELREGAPSRVTVGTAEGAYHGFEIEEAGTYRLVASAAGRLLPCRLEDADGWPLETPGAPARFERRFEPGRYRLLLLPEAAGSRRVTLLERVAEPPRLDGHGPHPLPLDRTVGHLWVEPAADTERTADRWEFALPAPATLSVALTGEMQGEIRLRAAAPGSEPLAKVQPGRGWSGLLPAGRYSLSAVCSRRNNLAPYEITIRAAELLAGTSRPVSTPAAVPVSVGVAGLFEFATSGSADVQARLVDGSGATIAEQEDRPDDWNVQLAARLLPGTYRLELAPTGAGSAPTVVAMRAIVQREEPELALPAAREVRPGDDVAAIPLAIPAGASLLLVRAGADETVGCALDATDGGDWAELWSSLGRAHTLGVPLKAAPGAQPPTRYRLRLWSLDRRGSAIRVAAFTPTPPRVTEGDLSRGVQIAAVPGIEPPVAVAAVALVRPGLLRLETEARWSVSGRSHRPLTLAGGAAISAQGTTLWAASDLAPGAREATLRGGRVALAPGEPVSVELPADGTLVACDIEAHGSGPRLVTASAAAGQVGVRIVPLDQVDRVGLSATSTAVVGVRAATALIDAPGPAAALVWRADPSRPAALVTLHLSDFAEGSREALPAGPAGGSLVPGSARRFTLPRGDKRLRLVLGPGLAAALASGGTGASAHDAGAGTLEETVESTAETLVVVNAGSAPAPWAIDVLTLDARERSPAVTAATPRIGPFAAAGTARVTIAPDDGNGAPLRLRTFGTANLPTYLAADGRILSGDTFAVGSGGDLLLPHGRSLAAVWVERPGGKASGLWGETPAPRERAIDGAGIIRLDGPSAGLAAKVATPSVLHLRTVEPLVGVIRRPTGPPEDFVQSQGAPLDLYLAPGATSIWLRSPSGADLRGSLEVLLSPVTAIGEGPGPESSLAPGMARYFSFSVEREGLIGIGVRAVPDSVSCRLLDGAGRTIGGGVVQMPRLAPGSYLLAVRAPADGGPVLVRPAIAGIVAPGSDPPEDVVRRYLRLSRGEPEDEGTATPALQAPESEEGE